MQPGVDASPLPPPRPKPAPKSLAYRDRSVLASNTGCSMQRAPGPAVDGTTTLVAGLVNTSRAPLETRTCDSTSVSSSTQQKYGMLKNAGLNRWVAIVEELGAASGLFNVAKSSPVRATLIMVPVASSAASTLHKHLEYCSCWSTGNEKPHTWAWHWI